MSLLGLIIGGLIGTIVMTGMMIMGGNMGMMPPDWMMIKDGLGGMLNEKMGLPQNFAMIIHFIMGTLVFPLIYFYIWADVILAGYLGAIIMMLIPGIIMILMFPMLGAPKEWRGKMAMGVIAGHIIYPLIMVFTGTLL